MDDRSQSVRDALLERVVQALADGGVAEGRVYRSREIALRRGLVPAVVVRPASELTEPYSDDVDRNRLSVAIEIHTRGDPFDALADPVATAAHAVVMRASSLREIAASIRRRSTSWDAQEADETAGMTLMLYQFTYLSGADDLAALA